MPRQAEVAEGKFSYVQIRMKSDLKNEVVEHCAEIDATLSQWVTSLIMEGLREQKGLPPVPPARIPIPLIQDEIRAYLSGETLLRPCGKTTSCAGVSGDTVLHAGMEFCNDCGLRLT